MNNQTKNIVWMMDETIANSHPKDWGRIGELETNLINLAGDPKFGHQIISPLKCLPKMVDCLRGKNFSCVIDLTGWLHPAINEVLPFTQVVDEFSMSRVRMVSSPKLETTGYTVSMSPQEIEQKKREIDISRPLIVDDTSFSGWTSIKTMEMWGINPENASHAFLIANTGFLGSNIPGSVGMLNRLGSNVVFGHEIQTPNDDGWHLKDLHDHPSLDQALVLSLLFQEFITRNGEASSEVRNFFSNETVIKTLFPNRLTSEEINNLNKEGKFTQLNGKLTEGSAIHTKNPFLWASPYFGKHVDTSKLIQHKDELLENLRELRSLTTNPEGSIEATNELRNEVKRLNTMHTIEGRRRGIERG